MVIWSIPAKEDLKKIYDYIARDSQYYARKVSQEIVEKSEKLNNFPERGRIVPEIDEPNIRELIIYSYRLVYEISPNKIEILALIHGKQDFSSGNMELYMNTREKRVRAARWLISDERLTAFFRAIRENGDVIAVKLINEHLDKGEQLDDIFYTGEGYGYSISVKKISQSSFVITFGCVAGHDAGDGGNWQVSFAGDRVHSVHGGISWII